MSGPGAKAKADLNEEAYLRLCSDLQIERPDITFMPIRSERFYGHYLWPENAIRVYLNLAIQQYESLSSLQGQIVRTILHEVRHAWQHQTGVAGSMGVEGRENDANDFAATNVFNYRGIVRVRRTFPGSGMSRLSRAESRVR